MKTKVINQAIGLFALLTASSLQLVSAEQLLNFEVSESGVHQVTHEDLLSVGLDLSGEALNSIALLNQGEAIQVQVTGSATNGAEFGPGSSIRFVGKALDTLYTKTNVYTLSLDAAQQRPILPEPIQLPARAAYATSYLASTSFAPQNEYTFASPDQSEPWYAKRVLALRKSAKEVVQIDLPDFAPGGNSGSTKAKMNMKLWGGTDLLGSNPDHHVRVEFNGQPLIDQTFDGFVKQELTAEVPNLVKGQNSVTIALPLDQGYDYEVVNLDSVTIDYPRAFVAQDNALSFQSTANKFLLRGFTSSDLQVFRESPDGNVTQLDQAEVLGCQPNSRRCALKFGGAGTLSKYYAVANEQMITPKFGFLPVDQDIKSANAEYLIITHPDFIAGQGEPDPLSDLRDELDASFASIDVVDVEQVYAQFGDHIFDPQAIKNYIQYAAANRGTRYVLLVGGDVYDYHGYQNSNAQSFIPSIYRPTSELMNFAPVDAAYADIDGNDTPDLAIGRLPVRNIAELATLVDKRAAYQARTYRQKAVFAADKFDDLQQYSFKLDALSIAQKHFTGWDISEAFLDDAAPRATRAKIVGAVNQGVSLTSFFGHSSTAQWSFSGLFNGSDAANLDNAGRPTIVTQWGCWNTYYVNPNEDSMGHRFMMEGEQGAVGVLGATTLTSARNEKQLAEKFFKYIESGDTIGEAMVNAKSELAQTNPEALDVILGWTLLGFPELTL